MHTAAWGHRVLLVCRKPMKQERNRQPRWMEAGQLLGGKSQHTAFSFKQLVFFKVTFVTLLYGLSTSPCHLPEKFNSPSNRKTGAILIFIIFYTVVLHMDTFTL